MGETEAVLVTAVSSHNTTQDLIISCQVKQSVNVIICSVNKGRPCGNSRVYQSHRSTIHHPTHTHSLGARSKDQSRRRY